MMLQSQYRNILIRPKNQQNILISSGILENIPHFGQLFLRSAIQVIKGHAIQQFLFRRSLLPILYMILSIPCITLPLHCVALPVRYVALSIHFSTEPVQIIRYSGRYYFHFTVILDIQRIFRIHVGYINGIHIFKCLTIRIICNRQAQQVRHIDQLLCILLQISGIVFHLHRIQRTPVFIWIMDINSLKSLLQGKFPIVRHLCPLRQQWRQLLRPEMHPVKINLQREFVPFIPRNGHDITQRILFRTRLSAITVKTSPPLCPVYHEQYLPSLSHFRFPSS